MRVMEAGLRGRNWSADAHLQPKGRAGKETPRFGSIVMETVKLLRASIPSTISIRVNIRSESGMVLGDPVQMQQVLMNLCTNAAHAMREKGGVLDVELSDFSVSPSNGIPTG